MNQRLTLILLFSSTLCLGQSVLTTPGSQTAVLNQRSAVHPTGRIVGDMKPTAASVADIPAFPLEDGDSYYILPRLGTVQVAGAVYNENAFRYQPTKQVATYLADAGGPNRQADKKHAFVFCADGTVVAGQSHSLLWHNPFENPTLLPGDSIVVPAKLKSPNNFAQQLPCYKQILSSAALPAPQSAPFIRTALA